MMYSTNLCSCIYRVRCYPRAFLAVMPKVVFTHARKTISSIVNGVDNHSTGMTVGYVRDHWVKKLADNHVPEPRESVSHILTHVLQLKNVEEVNKIQHKVISPELYELAEAKLLLRLDRMPVQYIIEEWDFLGMTLKMCPPVFIPRPETEDLVSIISAEVFSTANQKTPVNCLEIGCGTGAISLGLLSNHSMLAATAIDANPKAVALAQENAIQQKLNRRISLICRELQKDGTLNGSPLVTWNGHFDFLVSNPPYIPTDEIKSLDPEVQRFESHLALDGGRDGTELIEVLIRHGPKWLRPQGSIFLEIDPRQVEKIKTIAQTVQLYRNDEVIVKKDCFGVDRFVILKCI